MARLTRHLTFLAFALLVPSTRVAAVTVPPDSTSPPLAAIDCLLASGAIDDPNVSCPSGVCDQTCDAAHNQAKAQLILYNFTLGLRYAQATVYTDFTVAAASNGSSTTLDGTISYDVAWSGFWSLTGVLTGFNDVNSTMSLILWDQTAGGSVVAQTLVHSMDASSAGSLPEVPLDLGVGWDDGGTVNSLTAKVVRGHTYRIGLKLRIEGKGLLNANILVEYFGPDHGLKWNTLRVSIAPDLAERIAKLEEELRHHTHTYLTGKGEGHNNTVATTSEAIIQDDGPPGDEESKVLPPQHPNQKALPSPSVLVMSSPNPFSPIATITYRLPAALPVSLRVYDAQGRLVSTLVDSGQEAGEHQARLDASGLASGIYYYRIDAGPFTETRKVTLLK